MKALATSSDEAVPMNSSPSSINAAVFVSDAGSASTGREYSLLWAASASVMEPTMLVDAEKTDGEFNLSVVGAASVTSVANIYVTVVGAVRCVRR